MDTHGIRIYQEQREDAELHPAATRSAGAARPVPEPPCPIRTAFQRDRDRVIHSKAFRRLKHKTQVFIAPDGDHFRTRLTHTLEVTQVARTIARALRLNEDLVEAIGLAHDLGHTPFGHAGERALAEVFPGFRHNEQSLRVVDRIEKDGQGLNLTEAVRDGILRHSKPEGDITGHLAGRPATPEAQVVKISDGIAYINHDIDDALRAGVLRREELPAEEIALLGETGSERIETLVRDLIDHSARAGDIVQGEEVGAAMARLRAFMFERVYLGDEAQREQPRIERMLRALFHYYVENPPPALAPGADRADRVIDWLAGMTDRFAIRAFEELAVPKGF